ncbi:MAG: preprotein translocase subunit SecE [Acidobacteriota bacterium]
MEWFQKWKKFIGEVRMELRRTTWPNRNEVRNTTIVVLVTVFIFAAFLGVMDLVLSRALQEVLAFFAQ